MADPIERDSVRLSLDQMMLADRPDGARLRAVFTLAVSDDQPHFLTDIQVLERSVHHAVPVEVDVVALGGLNEAVSVFAGEPHDGAVDRYLMRLHVARHLTHVILEPARRGIEGIADGHVDIFVGLVFRAAPLHDDLLSGNGDVDADIVEVTLVVMPMRSFDDDPAAG